MSKFASVTLAGALALSAVAVSAGSASADGWRHRQGPPPPYRAGPSYDAGAAVAAGAIMGLAVGSIFNPYPAYPAPVYPAYAPPPPPPYPVYPAYRVGPDYAVEAHIQWCSENYQSYNAETDTWVDYRGVVHRCEGGY